MTWLEDATLLAIAARTLATYALVWDDSGAEVVPTAVEFRWRPDK